MRDEMSRRTHKLFDDHTEYYELLPSIGDAVAQALRDVRNEALEEAASHAERRTRRSGYFWSEGGEYSRGDVHNEAAIGCAIAIMEEIRALKDSGEDK